MENARAPLDELQADNAREIAENIQRNDEAGCFYRLMEMFDPNRLGVFIRAESARGVSASEIIEAAAQGMAYHLVAISMMATDSRSAYRDLVVGMQRHALDMMAGDHQVGMVVVGPDDVQREETVQGRFRPAQEERT